MSKWTPELIIIAIGAAAWILFSAAVIARHWSARKAARELRAEVAAEIRRLEDRTQHLHIVQEILAKRKERHRK